MVLWSNIHRRHRHRRRCYDIIAIGLLTVMATRWIKEFFNHIRFMRRRMFFKIGVTLIIFVGIILFFIIDVEDVNRGYYQRVPVKDGIYFMEMAFNDPEAPITDTANGVEYEDGRASIENDVLNTDINSQIDKEQNELLAHRRKPHGRNDDDTFIKNLDPGKQEFYYDNSIPHTDRLKKRKNSIELFHPGDQKPVVSRDFRSPGQYQVSVHLCVVVCENRAAEALTMLKSAAIVTTEVGLVFHIVADKERQPIIQAELDSWPAQLQRHISYHVYGIAFPQGPVTLTAWNKLYKPCASQRLFLPDRLTSVDSLIYVDTDTVFLQSVADLWSFFEGFNSTQLVGLVRESEDGTAGWYNRFASHPYYGDYGVNSGVMLMNMTRIRAGTNWLSVLQEDYEKYRLAMTWGDQDLINIYLAKRPEQVYVIPCNWNYRADHCMYMSNCREAEKKGVSLVHASRGAFYSDKEPVFGAVYQAFQRVGLGRDQVSNLVSDLETRFKHVSSEVSSCSYVSSLFLTQLVRFTLSQRHSQQDSHSSPQETLQNSQHAKSVDSLPRKLTQASQSDVNRNSGVVNMQQKAQLGKNVGADMEFQNSLKRNIGSVRRNHERRETGVGEKNVKLNSVDGELRSSDVKFRRGAGVIKGRGLSKAEAEVKKGSMHALAHNEVYINNKLKAGRFHNVMSLEEDVVLESVESKVPVGGVKSLGEVRSETGGGDKGHVREVRRNGGQFRAKNGKGVLEEIAKNSPS